MEELDNQLNYEHPNYIRAIASISKQLSSLDDQWGLTKWPTVNPKNIRDKIYVILQNKKEPMHFNDIASAISSSKFRKKDVTLQAIHNELIKDPRFVLIGRGIYALRDWGYKKGTVSQIITSILEEAKTPLTREEIVKNVARLRKQPSYLISKTRNSTKELIKIPTPSQELKNKYLPLKTPPKW